MDYDTGPIFNYGLADDAKDIIDGKMAAARQSVTRGALEVLGSGFGKGLLITAALITTAIVATAIFAPAALGIAPGVSVGSAVGKSALIAGNYLLGGAGGLLALAGGAVGSLVAAHNENHRISKEAAEAQAVSYARLREAQAQVQNQPPLKPWEQQLPQPQTSVDLAKNPACADMPLGHCARLLQERNQPPEQGKTV